MGDYEKFANDPEADTLLSRVYREPFAVPNEIQQEVNSLIKFNDGERLWKIALVLYNHEGNFPTTIIRSLDLSKLMK